MSGGSYRGWNLTAPIIVIQDLAKRFGTVRAVEDLSLTINSGETVALLGPNGAGKTTMISMLLGLFAADCGSVQVVGQSPQHAIAAGQVGTMLQDASLMPGVSSRELLTFVRSLYPEPMQMTELVELAGITSILNRRVDHLSGGEAQRVRFALAIAGNPTLLILDEPTTAMDVQARRHFWDRMRALAKEGKTILFATHYLEEANSAGWPHSSYGAWAPGCRRDAGRH